MSALVLPTCKRLRAAGYPQEKSHLRWAWYVPPTDVFHEPTLGCAAGLGIGDWYEGTAPDSKQHLVDWCACPDALDVLAWLESKGIPWWVSYTPRDTQEWHAAYGGLEIIEDSAEALICAALDHMEMPRA
jgi:hypothetical protein